MSTAISLGAVKRSGVKRIGINIQGQNYYDSGQMLRDLTFNNPGFEGGTWQTIIKCAAVTPTSCTDVNTYCNWPSGFMAGASYEVISGSAAGQTGTVESSNAGTLAFEGPFAGLAVGDYLIVRQQQPGDPAAGWWPTLAGGTLTAETVDLSPNTPGRQALRLTTSSAGQSAQVITAVAGGGK